MEHLKVNRIYGLIFLLIGLLGCNPEPSYLPNSENYFPLRVGGIRVYDVEETTYLPGKIDPNILKFEEKHIIRSININKGSSQTEDANVEVWRRTNGSSEWVFTSIYSVEKRPNEIIINNNSIPVIMLLLPIKLNSVWNSNVYNTEGESEFKVQSLNENVGSWDKTVKVVQREKSTLIDYYNTVQYYNEDIGLVYEEDIALEYCQLDNCIGQNIIDSGYSRKRILKEYVK